MSATRGRAEDHHVEHVDPESVELKPLSRATSLMLSTTALGNLEIVIGPAEDLETAKTLFLKSYEVS